jgi:hypothetical protein
VHDPVAGHHPGAAAHVRHRRRKVELVRGVSRQACTQNMGLYIVTRWFIFKPKIPIWVNLGGPEIGKCRNISMCICNILRTLGIFYDHLVYFVFVWDIFSGFGTMYLEKSGNPGPLVRRQKV